MSPNPVPGPTPPTTDPVGTITRRAWDRVVKAVLRVEAMPPPPPRGGRGGIDGWETSHRYGYCAAGATGSSSTQMGTGTATLCSFNISTGVLTNDGTSIPFWNAGGSFGGPAYILLGWCQGAWTAVVVPCAAG